MNTAKLLSRIRRENVESELLLLKLVRRRNPGDQAVNTIFDACYGDIVHYTVEELSHLQELRRKYGLGAEAQQLLCQDIREALWRYLRIVESRWREERKWLMGRQWKRCLSSHNAETGQRQSFRNLVEWFAYEYCRRLDAKRPASRSEEPREDEAPAPMNGVVEERLPGFDEAADGESTPTFVPSPITNVSIEEVIVERPRRDRRSSRRRRRRRRYRHARRAQGRAARRSPAAEIRAEMTLLDMRRSPRSDGWKLNEAFQRTYGDIIEHAAADYVRLRLHHANGNGGNGADFAWHQQIMARHIRDAFWRYVATVEEHWRAKGVRSVRRKWRHRLSPHGARERQSLRTMVEWFVDEYCRRRRQKASPAGGTSNGSNGSAGEQCPAAGETHEIALAQAS